MTVNYFYFSDAKGDGLASAGNSGSVQALAKQNKVALVSAITVDPTLFTEFMIGAAESDVLYDGPVHATDYGKQSEIIKKKNAKGKQAEVVAIVGGNYAYEAVAGETATNNTSIVCLVGKKPAALKENVLGGVSLESIQANDLRKVYLKKKNPQLNDNQIFLYTNKNSSMHADEVGAWNSPGTTCAFSGADIAAKTNNPNAFAADFVAGGLAASLDNGGVAPGANAVGVIISDDPFFRATKDQLVAAVTTWLGGGATRYAIFPSSFYADAVTDAARGQCAIVGPDLLKAFRLLGVLAKYYAGLPQGSRPPIGFCSVPLLSFEP